MAAHSFCFLSSFLNNRTIYLRCRTKRGGSFSQSDGESPTWETKTMTQIHEFVAQKMNKVEDCNVWWQTRKTERQRERVRPPNEQTEKRNKNMGKTRYNQGWQLDGSTGFSEKWSHTACVKQVSTRCRSAMGRRTFVNGFKRKEELIANRQFRMKTRRSRREGG